MPFKIDPTVSMGNLISVLTMIVAMSMAYAKLDGGQKALIERLADIALSAQSREIRVRALELTGAAQAERDRSMQDKLAEIIVKQDKLERLIQER